MKQIAKKLVPICVSGVLALIIGAVLLVTVTVLNNRPEVKFKREIDTFFENILEREEFSALSDINENRLCFDFLLNTNFEADYGDGASADGLKYINANGRLYVNASAREMMLSNVIYRANNQFYNLYAHLTENEFCVSDETLEGTYGVERDNIGIEFVNSDLYSAMDVEERERATEIFSLIEQKYDEELEEFLTSTASDVSDIFTKNVKKHGNFYTYSEYYGTNMNGIDADVMELVLDAECIGIMFGEFFDYFSSYETSEEATRHLERICFLLQKDVNVYDAYNDFLCELADVRENVEENVANYLKIIVRRSNYLDEPFMIELISFDEGYGGERSVFSIRTENYADLFCRDIRVVIGENRYYYQVEATGTELYRSNLKINGQTYFKLDVSRMNNSYTLMGYDGRGGELFSAKGIWNFQSEEKVVSIDSLVVEGERVNLTARLSVLSAKMPKKMKFEKSIFSMSPEMLEGYFSKSISGKDSEFGDEVDGWQ